MTKNIIFTILYFIGIVGLNYVFFDNILKDKNASVSIPSNGSIGFSKSRSELLGGNIGFEQSSITAKAKFFTGSGNSATSNIYNSEPRTMYQAVNQGTPSENLGVQYSTPATYRAKNYNINKTENSNIAFIPFRKRTLEAPSDLAYYAATGNEGTTMNRRKVDDPIDGGGGTDPGGGYNDVPVGDGFYFLLLLIGIFGILKIKKQEPRTKSQEQR